MTIRIQTLIAEVESLPETDQDDLADMIEVFLAARDEAVFTPEELEHIARIEAEPFVEADPKEIAALFGRRG